MAVDKLKFKAFAKELELIDETEPEGDGMDIRLGVDESERLSETDGEADIIDMFACGRVYLLLGERYIRDYNVIGKFY